MTGLRKTVFVAIVLCVAVGVTLAQVTVDVSFNPSSPVPPGPTTLQCDFTLGAGDSLGEQYWQIVGGSRFFTYRPGANPEVTITPEYQDKVISYDTSNPSSVLVLFNVTACDVEQFYCNVLGVPSATEGNDQQSLVVQNFISPTLKVDGAIPERKSKVTSGATTTLSCELNNAGPPEPELLALEMNGEVEEDSSGYRESNVTCMFDYPSGIQYVVTQEVIEELKFRCRVDYRDSGSQYSEEFSLLPENTQSTVYAFTVSMSVDDYIDSNPVVFDTVLTDTHEMYSPFSGIFTPPVQGYYFLTTSLLSTDGSGFAVYIRRNDQVLCKSFSPSSSYFAGVCSAVVELFAGDQVRVTADENNPGTVRGEGFSGFSGYLVSGV